MGKSLFLSSIPFDQATVLASSQSGALPASNLQYQDPEKKWRALDHTPRLAIRLPGAGRACNALAVIAHNAMADATLRVQGGLTVDSVTGVAAPYVDTGFVSMWPSTGKPTDATGYANFNSLVLWTNPQDLPWWSVTFNDPSNVDPFEAGRVMIEQSVRPEAAVLRNEIGIQVVTKGEQRRGDFNRLRTEKRGPNGRRMLLPYTAISKDVFRKDFFNFQMLHGITKDFFYCADPSVPEDLQMYSMQSLFENLTEFGRLVQFDARGGVWHGDMIITEQL